jgi:hypothetical protein
LLREQLCGVEAALLQKIGRMHVQALKPRGVGDNPVRDPSETPHDQPAAYADREQGHAGSNEDRDHLWKARLQPPLQRPDQRDDEQGESHGHHHGTRRP